MVKRSIVVNLFGVLTLVALFLTVYAHNLYNKQFQRYDREDKNRSYTGKEIGLDEGESSEEIDSNRSGSNRKSSHRMFESDQLEDLELKLSKVCGRKQSSYISAGPYAKAGEFPSYTFLINYDGNKSSASWEEGRSTCGGTILDEYHILTAAHCLTNDWVTGFADAILDFPKKLNTLPYRIISFCNHPDYDPNNPYTPDLAVARVHKPFKFGRNVQSACLPVSDYGDERWGGEAIVHQIGMGVSFKNGTYVEAPEKLRILPVDKIVCPAGYQSNMFLCFKDKDPRYVGNICGGE